MTLGMPPRPSLPPQPSLDDLIEMTAAEKGVDKRDICVVDFNVIQTMAFKNTGVCSENCRKFRDKEPIHKYKAIAP